MKKAIIIGLSVVFSLLIAVVVLPFVIDLNKYNDTVKERAKPYLPRDFDFRGMDLTILKGFGVEMKGIRIGENPAFGKGDFLNLGRLNVKVKLLPLLKGQLEVKKVILNKPEIHLFRNAKGEFSYSDIVGGTQTEEPTGTTGKQKKKSDGGGSVLAGLLVSELAIRQGAITFTDEFGLSSPRTTTIDMLDLDLKDVSLTKPVTLSMAARLPGGKDQNFRIKGKVEDFKNAPQWDIAFQSQSLNLEDIIACYPSAMPDGMKVSGLVDFEVISKGTLDDLRADGKLETKDLKIYQSGTSTGFVKGMSIDFHGQKKKGETVGNGKIGVKAGEVQSVAFENMNSQFEYQSDHLKIQSFQAQAFQGDVTMTGDVETKKLQWTMKPILKNIDMEKVVDSFTQYKGMFDGKFSGSFTANGLGFGNLVETVNAHGSFRIDNGRLKNFNLVDTVLESLFDFKGVSGYLKSDKGELSKQKLTRFDYLDCKFAKAKNTVNVQDMTLRGIHTAKDTATDAFFNGSLDIKTQNLDLKGKLVLPPKYSADLAKKAEPVQALIDSDKRMVLPLSIGGSLSSPRPMLDSSSVATAMAKYYGGKELEKGLEKLGKEIGLPKDALKDKKNIEQPVENLIKGLFGDDSGKKKQGDKP